MTETRWPASDMPHAAADLEHLAGELVAENLRELRAVESMRLDGDHDRTHRELVEVGAADAAPERPQKHLVAAGSGRVGDVLDADVLGTVEHCCLHRW